MTSQDATLKSKGFSLSVAVGLAYHPLGSDSENIVAPLGRTPDIGNLVKSKLNASSLFMACVVRELIVPKKLKQARGSMRRCRCYISSLYQKLGFASRIDLNMLGETS